VSSQRSAIRNIASAPLRTAADLGVSRSTISRRVATGALHVVHRGVYSLVPPAALSQESRWVAALIAVGDGAALGRLASAALWQAIRWPPRVIDVIAPRYRRSFDDVRVYQCRGLDPRDVTTHRGIPVTTVPRTLVDLTDVLIAEELTNIIHEAAFRRRISLPAIADARARANGRHNLAVLDEALRLWQLGSAGLKSRVEKAFFELVVAAGLPRPVPNLHVEGVEVDASWPGTPLIVELDGPNHLRPPNRRADASRDRILAAAGYTVLRFTELEIERRPEEVVAAVTGQLA
jgi:hypothetical protein